jgi:LytS/YehU family sensor histidine kinase
LENELEALNLYLEMEALRFKGKFTFSISYGKEVEVNYIEIPPLIIQPYVENAIWHGLMHKEGMGHIHISVEQQQELLTCTIEDDGIGRVRAAQLKSKSATKSKSLGMQITAHRLELLHALNGKQIRVEVVDLVDDSAQACGTKVILSLPIGLSIE